MIVIPTYLYPSFTQYSVFYFRYHLYTVQHDLIKSNWIPAASFKHSIASYKQRIRK